MTPEPDGTVNWCVVREGTSSRTAATNARLTGYISTLNFLDIFWLKRLLVVLCVVIVVVTSFFLFFWNRLLGWVLGFVLRTLLWKSSNVWIDMGSNYHLIYC